MVKNYFLKSFRKLFLRDIDDLKIQNGKLFENRIQREIGAYKQLNEVYFKIFSQDFEDGIIQYLIKSLNINSVKFVEIGTQDYSESNTRYIYETIKCDGLIIDPYPNLKKHVGSLLRIWKNNLKIYNNFVDGENINLILNNYSFNKNIDLFSIDIDGIDYWVLKEIPKKISKIFIVEYNPYFGPSKEITTPNIKRFDRFKYHPTGFCWGASLKAILNLMNEKGYKFLGTNRLNNNAFFLNEDYLSFVNIDLPSTNDLTFFTNAKFNIFKKNNNMTSSFEMIKDDILDLEIFDLKEKKKVKFINI